MCGLWANTKSGLSKFKNKVSNGWNKTKNWMSDNAETLGKVADTVSYGASLFGPAGMMVGKGIQTAKQSIAANSDEDSAWGRFARNGVKGKSQDGTSNYKPPLILGQTTSGGHNTYSMNTQAAGGYGANGGGRGRYKHSRSIR